ncbi:MAG: glycosyltransferase family 61 protein, partial [Bacteroidales bacterium]|nr:glycosyltransferase family 61 protein [Bacteroidales bacterium]
INFAVENAVVKKPANFIVYDKIYYSRRKYGIYRDYGDEYIEQFFTDNGYKIIYPEEYSVIEKLLFVHECSHFASITGTSTHFSLFAKKSTKIIVFNKQIELNRFQIMIDEMKGYKVTYIDSYLSLFPVQWLGPFLHTITDNLISFARDNNMKLPQKCANFDNIKKYLLLYFKQKKTFDEHLASVYRENAYFMKELYGIVHDDFLRQLEEGDYDSMRFLLPHIKRWGKNKIKKIYRKMVPEKIRKIVSRLRGKV